MDCLILGGGVIGLSLAYELAGHGLRVRVVERGAFGQEASWAGAGILPAAKLIPGDFPLEQLAGLSSELHPRWSAQLREETGIDNGYRSCGGIYLARDPEVWHGLELAADDWYGRKIPVERLTGPRLRELAPALGVSPEQPGWPHRVLGAYYTPGEAQLRNPRHLQALLAACQHRAVKLSPHTEVRGFHVARGRVTSVETDTESLAADTFIVAAGAWTSLLLEKLPLHIRVRPVRGQIVLYRCERPMLGPVVNEGTRYIVPRDDGRVLVGSTEELAGFVKANTEAGLAALQKFAREVVPTIAASPIEKTWSGLRPGTADGLPYLGPIPEVANVFVAAGHFRAGLHLSTGTAVVISQLVRGEATAIDLNRFRCDRQANCEVLTTH